ncbi:MAG: DNA methyltransferase [Verrucomicrobiota bacterium]
MDDSQRAQLGAHYTSEADIKTIVEPVLMQPFRREWAKIKGELAAACVKGKGSVAQRERLAKFQKQLSSVTVLDPGCGSGNFLYVSLQLLLGLEKEVITFAVQLGFAFRPQVSVSQLKAIEINPYAFELAQVSVQIGYLQWRRDNGFDNDRTPVLQVLDGFQNEDALLVPHFHSKAKTLKEAQAGEHKRDDSLKFYTEREWPKCDVIVSNPPFLGDKLMRGELGDDYVEELRKVYGKRIPGQSDLCCYWFEKARDLIEHGKCKRAGLLATQGIRGGANREVLKRIKETGDIFFAISDREWTLDGAVVHVSMIAFDAGSEKIRVLDGKVVTEIHPNLSSETNITSASILKSNGGLGFIGLLPAGPFVIENQVAISLLSAPNAHPVTSSDVVRPYFNGEDVTRRPSHSWVIDFDTRAEHEAAKYEAAFDFTVKHIKATRLKASSSNRPKLWWLFGRSRPEFREASIRVSRFLATARVAKHRIFVWRESVLLPDSATVAFAREDDYFFGILQSYFHEVWALAQGTQLREKESGFRYTPTTCFETFPFPFADDLQPPPPPPPKRVAPAPDTSYAENLAAKNYFMGKEDSPRYGSSGRTPDEHRAEIAAAAEELNQLRERWLNPLEWTVERILEFPGSADGPWARYVVHPGKNGIGVVRYPRLEPRDADCAAKLKERTLTKLYNERPAWLDLAHKKLDAAVAAAYGFPPDLTDEQILERLLALNLTRAAEEVRAAKTKKSKTQRMKQGDELV